MNNLIDLERNVRRQSFEHKQNIERIRSGDDEIFYRLDEDGRRHYKTLTGEIVELHQQVARKQREVLELDSMIGDGKLRLEELKKQEDVIRHSHELLKLDLQNELDNYKERLERMRKYFEDEVHTQIKEVKQKPQIEDKKISPEEADYVPNPMEGEIK